MIPNRIEVRAIERAEAQSPARNVLADAARGRARLRWRDLVRVASVASVIAGACLAAEPVARADAPRAAGADEQVLIDAARHKAATLYPECTKKPTDADLKGAKGSHNAAKQFLERGQYDKAIQSWNDAYGFDCSRPSVFYNLANAYERAGDRPMTIAVLELAIQRDPDADKPTLTAKTENLKKALANEPKGAPEGPKADGKGAGAGPTTGGDAAKPGDHGGRGPRRMERPFGPAPWITFAVGGAALVASVPVLIVGRGKVSDAEKVCPTHKGCDNATRDLGNSGNTLTGVGIGLAAGGGAIAIGSLVWQLAGNRPRPVPERAGLHVVPIVGASVGGAAVGGSF